MCWPGAQCFTFVLPFHPHNNTIIISVLHTKELWLERFSHLSKVAQLRVTDRIQTKAALFPKPELFTTRGRRKPLPRACAPKLPFMVLSPNHVSSLLLCLWSVICRMGSSRVEFLGWGLWVDFYNPHLSYSPEKAHETTLGVPQTEELLRLLRRPFHYEVGPREERRGRVFLVLYFVTSVYLENWKRKLTELFDISSVVWHT